MHRSLLFLLFAACAPAAATPAAHGPAPARAATRPTEPFRAEHRELKVHLGHVDGWIAALPTAPPAEQRAIMARVAGFFAEHIEPHAAWEESHLYPAVDRRASRGEPFTATMRWEHRVVGRWTGELRSLAAAEDGDARAFARRADQLLGLVSAHFEEEEEVLLPVLDAHMTPAEAEQELGGGHHAPEESHHE